MMIQRVNGSLAVSRAFGDYDYKSVSHLTPCQQLVSPEPDVYVIERETLSSPNVTNTMDVTSLLTEPPPVSVTIGPPSLLNDSTASAPVSPQPLGPGPTCSAPATPAIGAEKTIPSFGDCGVPVSFINM